MQLNTKNRTIAGKTTIFHTFNKTDNRPHPLEMAAHFELYSVQETYKQRQIVAETVTRMLMHDRAFRNQIKQLAKAVG